MQATQLFDLWKAPQLAKLAIAMQGPFARPKHALLAEQGETADTVLLVAEGEVCLARAAGAEARLRRRRQVGLCLLGNCQLLTRLGGDGAEPKWPFDVVCHTQTTCYMLPAEAFRALCSSSKFVRELGSAEAALVTRLEGRMSDATSQGRGLERDPSGTTHLAGPMRAKRDGLHSIGSLHAAAIDASSGIDAASGLPIAAHRSMQKLIDATLSRHVVRPSDSSRAAAAAAAAAAADLSARPPAPSTSPTTKQWQDFSPPSFAAPPLHSRPQSAAAPRAHATSPGEPPPSRAPPRAPTAAPTPTSKATTMATPSRARLPEVELREGGPAYELKEGGPTYIQFVGGSPSTRPGSAGVTPKSWSSPHGPDGRALQWSTRSGDRAAGAVAQDYRAAATFELRKSATLAGLASTGGAGVFAASTPQPRLAQPLSPTHSVFKPAGESVRGVPGVRSLGPRAANEMALARAEASELAVIAFRGVDLQVPV